MTNQHLITPPPELVREWREEPAFSALSPCSMVSLTTTKLHDIATRAARWGADQELDACVEWFREQGYDISVHKELRADRRPKPPSLAKEALEAARLELFSTHKNGALIIKALERLKELESNEPDL